MTEQEVYEEIATAAGFTADIASIARNYVCVDCGHEEEDPWLMCPECTTPEDWQAMRAEVAAAIERSRRQAPSQ